MSIILWVYLTYIYTYTNTHVYIIVIIVYVYVYIYIRRQIGYAVEACIGMQHQLPHLPHVTQNHNNIITS